MSKGEIDELKRRVAALETVVAALRFPPEVAEEPVDPFDEFWALYPRKVGKALARKAFSKVSSLEATIGLEAWLATSAFNPDPKYILHASTWLNQKCYNDEPVPYVSTFTKPQIGGVSSTRKALDAFLAECPFDEMEG